LYRTLQQQDLSPAQFKKESEIIQTPSCKVAASVLNKWITTHLHIIADLCGEDPPLPWLDGRTVQFVQLALITAREAIHNSGLEDYLGCNDQSLQWTAPTLQSTLKGRRELYGGGHQKWHVVHTGCHDGGQIPPQDLPALRAADTPRHAKCTRCHPQPAAGPNLCHAEACAAGAAFVAQAVELIQSDGAMGRVGGELVGEVRERRQGAGPGRIWKIAGAEHV
jgi:3-oxoacyl-(acyl-carrier-protein) synthase